MQSLHFDDGFKEFMINDDPKRVIKFNPSDFSILERYQEALENIKRVHAELSEDVEIKKDVTTGEGLNEDVELIAKVNKLIREQVDYIFDSDVADIAFGNQSPLSMVKGVPLFERFITAAQMHIEKELESEMKASQKRVNKYTSQVK